MILHSLCLLLFEIKLEKNKIYSICEIDIQFMTKIFISNYYIIQPQ